LTISIEAEVTSDNVVRFFKLVLDVRQSDIVANEALQVEYMWFRVVEALGLKACSIGEERYGIVVDGFVIIVVNQLQIL
jgi:hypothetical protein